MRKNLIRIIKIWIILNFFYISVGITSQIDISADKMEVFDSEGLVVFTGKVFGIKENFKIWCDKMYVYYGISSGGERQINKIIALGKVIMEKGKWKAYAGKAVYFRDQEKLILEETPKVWHDKNLIEGDIIIIYFKEDRSEILAKDQGRVRATVYIR
ncbi:MAG: LptA/OstA family protein [Nitrososphaerota archaeon]